MSTLYGDMYGDKKKAARMKLAGFAGIAAVIAGGCFAAYKLSDTVHNQVKLAFSKPEDYLNWVCEKNTGELAEAIGGSYQESLDARANGTGVQVSMRYAPGEDAKALLNDEIGDDSEISGIINGADSISMTAFAALQESGMTERVGLQFNDSEIMSVEGAFDLSNSLMFLRIPELKEQWIGTDYSKLAGSSIRVNIPVPDTSSMPAGSEIAASVRKYGMMLPAHTGEVHVERSVPVDISGIQTNYTEIAAPITIGGLLDTAQDILGEAQNDETLKSLVPYSFSSGGVFSQAGAVLGAPRLASGLLETADELVGEAGSSFSYSEAISQGSNMIDRLREEYAADLDRTIDLRIYVDPAGTIRGYHAALDEDVTFFTAVGEQGDQIGAEFFLEQDGTTVCRFAADAFRSGEALNGTARITVDDFGEKTAEIEFNNLECKGDRSCYLSGDLTVSLPEEAFSITLHLSSDGNSQAFDFPLLFEGKDYGTLSVSASRTDAGTVTIPDSADAYMVDLAQPSFTLHNYVDNEALVNFGKETMKKLGFSDETAEKVGSLLN